MADSRIKSVSDLLSDFFDRETAARGQGYADFRTAWRAIAGERLAEHSRPTDLRRGILIVEIEHQGWAQLLQIQKGRMLEDIGRRFPELEVRGMAFRLADAAFGPGGGAASTGHPAPPPAGGTAPAVGAAESVDAAGGPPVREGAKPRAGAEALPPELRAAFERMRRRTKA